MKTKAAVLYEQNQPLVIEEITIPEPREGQVLVKIIASGICRTQINEIKGEKGPDKFLPHTLGHEGAGIVRKVGKNVKKVKKGDHVVLTWIKGNGVDIPSSKYENNKGFAINSGAISTFMEYAVISENRLVVIPNEMPFNEAALLGCAIPTGAGIIKNSINLNKEKSISIFGIGGIGASALLYASAIGCSKIIAVDVNEKKLKFALDIGATQTINPKTENVISRIKEITDNNGTDYAVECSGKKEAMETAFASINNKGIAAIAGNLSFGETISINPFDLILGKKIIGTWGGETKPDTDIPLYAKMFLSRELKLDKLISHRFRLEEINEAIKLIEKGDVVRAIIVGPDKCI
ncbi:MAG: zinc-binding dehydrogenase [Actinobacteria bacterium]|nr:zinc-binding dehydrogenase [Actinomycetota bacterium]